MKIKFLTVIGILMMLSASFVSCIKDNAKDLGTRGTPRVRIGEAPENIQYFSFFPEARTIDLLTIRRDEVSEADMNQPLTVTLVNSADSIESYNNEHGSTYEVFPDSLYTLVSDKGVTKSGDNFTLSFAPRVSAITISIVVQGSKWDLAHTYGFYLKVADSGGKEIYLDKGEALAAVAIKNEWDGIYSIEAGNTVRYTAPGSPAGDALSGSIVGNPDVTLATTGPASLVIPEGNLQWAYGNNSGVGGIGDLHIDIDPATNLTSISSSLNGTLANWSGHDNFYDPATKTFYLGFIWNPTANVRTYEVVLKYKGPR